jgi:hypothetical protein
MFARVQVMGKSIAFMRRACQDQEWVSTELRPSRNAAQTFAYGSIQELQKVRHEGDHLYLHQWQGSAIGSAKSRSSRVSLSKLGVS